MKIVSLSHATQPARSHLGIVPNQPRRWLPLFIEQLNPIRLNIISDAEKAPLFVPMRMQQLAAPQSGCMVCCLVLF